MRTFNSLLQDYVDAKAKSGRRESSVRDIRQRLGKIGRSFGDCHIHTIVARELEDWLDENNCKAQTRINYLRILSGFFNYARKLKLIEQNPADKDAIDRPSLDKHIPGIFQVDDVERLLRAAETSEKEILPFLCLGFFAGLRTSELYELKWEDIDLESNLITVRPEVAKKRRQRFTTISDNLAAWLRKCVQGHGKICPVDTTCRAARLRIIKVTNVPWVNNGMRHTFASNHLAMHKDANKTAYELGHSNGVQILMNHYRNLVKPTDAQRYWKLLPGA